MLRFNEEIDINSQKNRISEKINVLNTKISNLRKKLQNKAYLKNALGFQAKCGVHLDIQLRAGTQN